LLIFVAGMVLVGPATWAATRVFSVALYRYATDAEAGAPFAKADLEQPFRRRRR
jgi:hypothetical protein